MLSGATGSDVSLNYAVIGGTAIAGEDYRSSTQNIVIAEGEVSKILFLL